MRLSHRSNGARYMQIFVCTNAAAAPRRSVGAHTREQAAGHHRRTWSPASQCRPDAPVTRDHTIEESLTDLQHEKDLKAMDSLGDALGGAVQRGDAMEAA